MSAIVLVNISNKLDKYVSNDFPPRGLLESPGTLVLLRDLWSCSKVLIHFYSQAFSSWTRLDQRYYNHN